ncbi:MULTISPECIES: hypothetical protein [unclassified Campylobacter]|uniref:hypothetical protein n=1 Tax=unclassified Campylobacter TaxID=2593542 RepID=UPI0016805911|nr:MULTISPECIES: hypothetical protein [unclassified Campylobacter]
MINKFINKGEKITLIIENVKEEFLPAFRGLAKSIDAKIKTNKNKAGNYYTNGKRK